MKKIAVTRDLFEGVVSFNEKEGMLQPLRLKADEIPLHNEGFVNMAVDPSGCRLRFATTSGRVNLNVEPCESESRKFDLTIDDELCETVDLPAGSGEVCFSDLPAGRQVLELWLPSKHPLWVRDLEIEDGTEFQPSPDTRKRWVTYGSSITHCRAAHSPARSWPATAARMRGLNVTSLGYAGQCHMDTLVAMMIRDMKADFISLKVGINMVGQSASLRTFRHLLTGMVRIIREKHPATPIAVVSPIISPPRENTPGVTGLTLCMMREELKIAVDRLRQCGDENVHYFNGLDIFGESLVPDCLPDLLHPNGDGYEIMGRNFAEKVIDVVGLQS